MKRSLHYSWVGPGQLKPATSPRQGDRSNPCPGATPGWASVSPMGSGDGRWDASEIMILGNEGLITRGAMPKPLGCTLRRRTQGRPAQGSGVKGRGSPGPDQGQARRLCLARASPVGCGTQGVEAGDPKACPTPAMPLAPTLAAAQPHFRRAPEVRGNERRRAGRASGRERRSRERAHPGGR